MFYINIFILFLLTSCTKEIDLTFDEQYKNISRQCFESKVEMFAYKGSSEHHLLIAGFSKIAPISIEDFLKHPIDWWTTDLYIAKHGELNESYFRPRELIPIKIGTKIYLDRIKIVSDPNVFAEYMEYIGRVDNESIKDLPVELGKLFIDDLFTININNNISNIIKPHIELQDTFIKLCNQ